MAGFSLEYMPHRNQSFSLQPSKPSYGYPLPPILPRIPTNFAPKMVDWSTSDPPMDTISFSFPAQAAFSRPLTRSGYSFTASSPRSVDDNMAPRSQDSFESASAGASLHSSPSSRCLTPVPPQAGPRAVWAPLFETTHGYKSLYELSSCQTPADVSQRSMRSRQTLGDSPRQYFNQSHWNEATFPVSFHHTYSTNPEQLSQPQTSSTASLRHSAIPSRPAPCFTLPVPPAAAPSLHAESKTWRLDINRPSYLHQLPKNVLDRICEYVGDYKKLIMLSQMDRFLAANVDTQLASYESKVSLVLRAENDFPKHWSHAKKGRKRPSKVEKDSLGQSEPRNSEQKGKSGGRKDGRSGDKDERSPGNFGCYLYCFKVIGPEQFEYIHGLSTDDGEPEPRGIGGGSGTASTLTPTTSTTPFLATPSTSTIPPAHARPSAAQSPNQWPNEGLGVRRHCIKCGVRAGFYQPGESIQRRVDGQLEKVWVCGCLEVHLLDGPDGKVECDACGVLARLSSAERRRR